MTRVFYFTAYVFVLQALGVDAVAGCVIMLGVAMGLGILILFVEHLIFKHALPFWRAQPKGTLWRSPNLMFFSQVRKEFTGIFYTW